MKYSVLKALYKVGTQSFKDSEVDPVLIRELCEMMSLQRKSEKTSIRSLETFVKSTRRQKDNISGSDFTDCVRIEIPMFFSQIEMNFSDSNSLKLFKSLMAFRKACKEKWYNDGSEVAKIISIGIKTFLNVFYSSISNATSEDLQKNIESFINSIESISGFICCYDNIFYLKKSAFNDPLLSILDPYHVYITFYSDIEECKMEGIESEFLKMINHE